MNINKGTTRGLKTLCIFISLFLHLLVALFVFWTINNREKSKTPQAAQTESTRTIELQIAKEEPQKIEAEEQEKQDPPSFAKSNPDQPEELPEQPEYIGKRNTRLSGGSNQPDLAEGEDMPMLDGEEKDELVTFDQDLQEGDVEHDGKIQKTPPAHQAAAAQPPTPPTPPSPPTPVQPEQELPVPPVQADIAEAQEGDSTNEDAQEEKLPPPPPLIEDEGPEIVEHDEDVEEELPTELISEEFSDKILEQSPTLDLAQLTPPPFESIVELDPIPAPPIPPAPTPSEPISAPSPNQTGENEDTVVYDPAFAPSAQPGLRPLERKSRRMGRFVFGSNASLNTASTPLGRYQEMLYRRIAYHWHAACAENRGDIIPGTIIIRILINSKGQIENLELMSRRHASVSQQSFTLTAIRLANPPPIPPAALKELIGDKLDMVFEFNFN